MSDIQSMTETAYSGAQSDDKAKADSLRFTPLRSHVIARTGAARGELALSRIIPLRRFQN